MTRERVNPKGEVTFELGGRKHHLAFSVNGIIEAEDAFDTGIAQIGAILAGGVEVGAVRAMVEQHLAAACLEQTENGKVMEALAPFIDWVAQATAKDGGTRFKHLRTLFRCALVDELPDLTDAEAGVMMGELGPEEAGRLVSEAFAAAFHQKAGADRPTRPAGKPATAPARGGTGRRS